MTTSAGHTDLAVRATVTSDSHWQWVAAQAVDVHRAQHDVGELAALLGILAHQSRLTSVLEIGGGVGGSAWAWSQLPRVRRIVSVSRDPVWLFALRLGEPVDQLCIPGDSTTAGTISEVRSLIPGEGFDLLVIDGGHDDRTVRSDWHAFAPMVRPGGLIVMHDTRDGAERDQLQVSRLWRELAAARATIELHANPGGPAGTGIVLA